MYQTSNMHTGISVHVTMTLVDSFGLFHNRNRKQIHLSHLIYVSDSPGQSMISFQTALYCVLAVMGHQHAATSPPPGRLSLPGPPAPRWWCALSMSSGSVWSECVRLHFQLGTYLSCAAARESSARLGSGAERRSDARWQMRHTEAAVWQHDETVTHIVNTHETVPLMWLRTAESVAAATTGETKAALMNWEVNLDSGIKFGDELERAVFFLSVFYCWIWKICVWVSCLYEQSGFIGKGVWAVNLHISHLHIILWCCIAMATKLHLRNKPVMMLWCCLSAYFITADFSWAADTDSQTWII